MSRSAACMSLSAPEPEPEDTGAAAEESGYEKLEPMSRANWTALTTRIAEVREAEEEAESVRSRLERMPSAYVLVFDVDTDDECARSRSNPRCRERPQLPPTCRGRRPAEPPRVPRTQGGL